MEEERKLRIFPWDFGERPFFVNPENGYEWYVDKTLTRHCIEERGSVPKLDAVVFYVVERIDGKLNPIERVLIDRTTNDVLAIEKTLDGMATKIDILRLIKK